MTSMRGRAFRAEGGTSGAPGCGARLHTGADGDWGEPDETRGRRKCAGARCGIADRLADPA